MSKISRRQFIGDTSLVGIGMMPGISYAVENSINSKTTLPPNPYAGDKLFDLAYTIQSNFKNIAKQLNQREEVTKKMQERTYKYLEIFNKEGDLSRSRNSIYGIIKKNACKNYNLAALATDNFIVERLKENLDAQLSASKNDTSEIKIIPDLKSLQVEYNQLPFQDVLVIIVKLKFQLGANSSQETSMRLPCTPTMKNGKISFTLFQYPIFSNTDGDNNDPVNNLPVKDRKDGRKQVKETLENILSDAAIDIPAFEITEIPIQSNITHLIVHDGIRLLSKVSIAYPGLPQEIAIAKNNFNTSVSTLVKRINIPSALNNKKIVVDIPELYAKTIFTELIKSKFPIALPADFFYSITVEDITNENNRSALFKLHIYLHYSYDWLIDDAEVTVHLDADYLFNFNFFPGGINVRALLQQYAWNINAEGFPPFGLGPMSPDDAVNATQGEIEGAMNDNQSIAFTIPTNDNILLSFLPDRLLIATS